MAVLGDLYEVTFGCQLAEQAGLNVRHYRVSSLTEPSPTDVEIAAILLAAFAPLYPPLLSAQATFVGLSIQKIFPLPPAGKTFALAPSPGLVAGDALPRQAAGLITLRDAFGTRRGHGRTYIPFPSETDNGVTAAPILDYVVRLQALASQFPVDRTIVGIGGGLIIFTPGLYHRDLTTFTPMTSATAGIFWASQRRRGSYGRPNPQFGS